MSRYIDLDRYIEKLNTVEIVEKMKNDAFLYEQGYLSGLIQASITAKEFPTADVVEVVRCKDCIHSSYYGKICHYSVGRDVHPDHYCGYGERKEQ